MQFTRRRVLAGLMTLAVGSVVATADNKKPDAPPIDPANQLVPAPFDPANQLVPPPPMPMPIKPVSAELPVLPSTPAPTPAPLPSVAPPVVAREPQLPPQPATVVTPRPVEPAVRKEPAKVSNVKVMLLLGETQPKFDVYCGDDAVLKVSCDKVDVRTPGEGTAMTPLKGSGHVSFTLPGYTGTCDEIVVLANTGEITITGNVKLISKAGKVESEIHGTTVRFRLSAAPVANVVGPGVINFEPLTP